MDSNVLSMISHWQIINQNKIKMAATTHLLIALMASRLASAIFLSFSVICERPMSAVRTTFSLPQRKKCGKAPRARAYPMRIDCEASWSLWQYLCTMASINGIKEVINGEDFHRFLINK